MMEPVDLCAIAPHCWHEPSPKRLVTAARAVRHAVTPNEFSAARAEYHDAVEESVVSCCRCGELAP